ncbi:outer membrane protein assembly factor BamA [Candidatus Pelagibacter sp.]|nr:outer membrane protein assembly factor BamA [Candidatus Pelagibacter sp.]
MTKFLTKILFSFFLIITSISAEIINEIIVEGNNRVSEETIFVFGQFKKGDDFTNKKLNNTLKNLYETNFFEDVNLVVKDKVLIVKVKEYPIVQEIIINGIKRTKTVEEIKEEITLKEKNPFRKVLIKRDLNTMLNIFKQNGFYFAEVNVDIEENSNDTVNLIYNIDRGDKATINEIKFIGDKIFKDRKLHSVITSEESKPWKFISRGKYLNIERINLDKRLLKSFYLDKGYYQAVITDAYSSIIDKKNFILTFNINAGKKFYFDNLNINLPDDFDPKKFEDLNKVFKKLKGKKYSYKSVEKILDEIDKISLIENYEFINANIVEKIDNNKINLTFDILETDKLYVNKINILGNNITAEEFIRNQLLVDEGDPFNELLHNKSINKLRSKGIFGSVKSNILDSDEVAKKDIEIIIEEKATGEITAAAGYGTDGSTISVGIKENNFNGKGITLETNLSLGEDSIRGLINYSHPNFAYSDRALTTSLASTVTDKLSQYGYKSTLNSVSLGTQYEQFENLFFSPSLSMSDESLETTSTASSAYKKQEGSYFDVLFSYGLTYDLRNSAYQPTDGYVSKWTQTIPLTSDNSTLINGYTLTKYTELSDDLVVTAGIYTKAANSLSNDDIRVSKRLYAPSSRLRGFETGKVGPKDGSDHVGGNYVTTFNTSSTIPYLFQTMENTDLKVFFDAGNVWGVDYSSSIDDSNKIRSSSGIALEIFTPVGPLSFTYAEAISKATTDKTENFRFQLGTTF